MARSNKYSLQINRLQRITMSASQIISWLLILIISMSIFQPSLAMHFDMNTPDQNNLPPTVQTIENQFSSDRQDCIVNFCETISACGSNLNCNLITSSILLQLAVQAKFSHRPAIEDVVVFTHFPDLLKRPPKP